MGFKYNSVVTMFILKAHLHNIYEVLKVYNLYFFSLNAKRQTIEYLSILSKVSNANNLGNVNHY